MKELSLNILDITENSVKAGAKLVEILLTETNDTLDIMIRDDGCGMKKSMLENVCNPFCTTRTTRKVGLGLPFLKLCAEQTGGRLKIESKHIDDYPDEHGTAVEALFYKNNIDFTPLGDIVSTVVTLIQGNPHMDFVFRHEIAGDCEKCIELDTRGMREMLGEDVPLDNFEVLEWIRGYLEEQYGA